MPSPRDITEPGAYELTADETDVVRVRVNGCDEWALVDAADAHLVITKKWQVLRGHNGKLYANHSGGYMHRVIAGTPPGMETDHINGNGLDNRRANLRAATASQNRANMGKPASVRGGHSSRFKGVSRGTSGGKWSAFIQVNGKTRNLGRYDVEEDAARAYDAAASEAWGAFAQLNFPSAVAS